VEGLRTVAPPSNPKSDPIPPVVELTTKDHDKIYEFYSHVDKKPS